MRLEPRRVALLTDNPFPPAEGIARHVLEIALRLDRRGFEPLIVARGTRGLGWRRESVGGLPLLRYPHLPIKPFHHAFSRGPLQAWLDDGADGADLLHVHLPLLPPLHSRLRRIVTVHSPVLSDGAATGGRGLKPRLLQWNARLVSRRFEQHHLDNAERVVAVSSGVLAELDERYRLAAPARVITNGVDTRELQPVPVERPRGPLLYVGRLGYEKGLFRLLEAVTLLGSAAPVLELAGEGPLAEALHARARLLGIADRVRFLGFLRRDALVGRLASAACLINPASYGSGPLTLLEGLATATPIVTTRTGLAADVEAMTLGQPPFVVADAGAIGLADAIEAVLVDQGAARERALAGRRLVERCFDWERIVDDLIEAYGWVERQAA